MKSILLIPVVYLLVSGAIAQTVESHNTTLSADLTGDGRSEHILFIWERQTNPSSADRFHIEIDGARFSFRGSWLTGDFFVVDVDTTDNYQELVVPEAGPSDDHAVHLFRFVDGGLVAMGTLPGRWGKSVGSISLDGGGILMARCRGEVLHTWFYACWYSVGAEHSLEIIQEPLYPLTADLVLKSPLVLQIAPGRLDIVAKLEVGDRISVTDTDNIRWCRAVTAEGIPGWFELKSFGELADGRRVGDVFSGLITAD